MFLFWGLLSEEDALLCGALCRTAWTVRLDAILQYAPTRTYVLFRTHLYQYVQMYGLFQGSNTVQLGQQAALCITSQYVLSILNTRYRLSIRVVRTKILTVLTD